MLNRILVALRFAVLAGIALGGPGRALAQTPNDSSGILNGGPALAPAIAPDEAPPAMGTTFWVSGDYLLARFQAATLSPLVTTSPAGTSLASAGVLGKPGTSVLFGGSALDNVRSGFRFDTGCWFFAEQKFGVEAGFMVLESQSTLFSASSDNFPILARPFVNAATGAPSSIVVAFPGVGPGSGTGAIDVRANSGNFYEWHLDLTEKALSCNWARLDGLFGYRFYRYDEGLRIRQSTTPNDPANFKPGTQIVSTDDFGTQNTFNGLDMGFRTHLYFWDNLSLDVLTKVAVGTVNHGVNIAGSQVTTAPGVAPVTQSGGLYALGSNIGRFANDDWKCLTEVGLTLNWQYNSNVRFRVGYTALLLNGIARASDQVDFVVNRNLLPPAIAGGPNRPAFDLQQTNMWISSVTFGMEFSY